VKQQYLFGKDVIKTISYNEGEIINDILQLHCETDIQLDPCYSIGNFYKRFDLKDPIYKHDINPQKPNVIKSNANSLPYPNNKFNTIMFDPPFLCGGSVQGKLGIIKTRFGFFGTMDALWEWYKECLKEFKRILAEGGILIFKNQDTVSSGIQYFSHVFIMTEAVKIGLYPKDLFILLAKQRVLSSKHSEQQHARKYHCYYWVFKNIKSRVKYE
jgi:hypothetical protein